MTTAAQNSSLQPDVNGSLLVAAGRGDRADPSSWPEIQGHLDVVLFEGWMLGFAPIKEEEAAKVSPCFYQTDFYSCFVSNNLLPLVVHG